MRSTSSHKGAGAQVHTSMQETIQTVSANKTEAQGCKIQLHAHTHAHTVVVSTENPSVSSPIFPTVDMHKT